jgi:stage II sporulation protein D
MLNIAVDGVAASIHGNRALLAPEGGDVDILMYEARTYRGGFLIENAEGALNVINILDVDLYLLGVLPMEMGLPSAPAEALKAQAVASRTYALKKRSAARSYDLVSGSSDQLYGGYGNEKSYTTAAVEATGGQAIFYDGQLIEAFFSSNGGGFTEDAENVWNESLPYAKAVASPYDASALDAPQDSGGYPGITYHWQVRYTLEELQSRITQWNKDYPDRKINIGALRSINAYALAYDPAGATITGQPNASGRVTKLDLLGADGLHSLYRENVRWFLGLRSALFTLTPEGGIAVRNGAGAAVMLGESIEGAKGLAANGQPSAINPGSGSFFVLTANGIEEINKENVGAAAAYLIDGKGYGHGVGLSQWGAIGMAQAGKTYRQIIEHYYNQGKNDGRLALRNVAEND